MKRNKINIALLTFLFVFSFSSYTYLSFIAPNSLNAMDRNIEVPEGIEHPQIDLPDLHLVEHVVKFVGKMLPAG